MHEAQADPEAHLFFSQEQGIRFDPGLGLLLLPRKAWLGKLRIQGPAGLRHPLDLLVYM